MESVDEFAYFQAGTGTETCCHGVPVARAAGERTATVLSLLVLISIVLKFAFRVLLVGFLIFLLSFQTYNPWTTKFSGQDSIKPLALYNVVHTLDAL